MLRLLTVILMMVIMLLMQLMVISVRMPLLTIHGTDNDAAANADEDDDADDVYDDNYDEDHDDDHEHDRNANAARAQPQAVGGASYIAPCM